MYISCLAYSHTNISRNRRHIRTCIHVPILINSYGYRELLSWEEEEEKDEEEEFTKCPLHSVILATGNRVFKSKSSTVSLPQMLSAVGTTMPHGIWHG